MTADAIWLFDSLCVLCDGGVHYTLRHEKSASIDFVSIQSVQGRKLAAEHGLDPDDPASFLFIEDNIAHTKSDGVIALARHLNGLARIVIVFQYLPKFIRDAAYDLAAKNRYRLFGKKNTCIIPTAENRARFVL